MAVNYDIQASVVDIRNDIPKATDTFLVDTNVWYWMTYTRASLGDRQPMPYQSNCYPAYINKALSVKSRLHRCELSLAELAHVIEKTELEIYSKRTNFDKKKGKEFRHNYPTERSGVVAEIQAAWGQVQSMAKPIDAKIDEAAGNATLTRFATQPLDGHDLFIIEAIMQSNILQVVTDDGDFATVPGIVVYTANSNVIQGAQSKGRLMCR